MEQPNRIPSARSIELSCSCGQRLRAVWIEERRPANSAGTTPVRFFVDENHRGDFQRRVAACPNCQRDLSGISAEDLQEELGKNWS